jgi:HD-GYP domain-containing protein (c-di-GMP phosphodiesterase class II)
VIDTIVDKTMENINQDTDILMGLMEMKDEEDFLFEHSLKSMMLALIFGKELNYTEKELDILGKAALLHDIGMMKLDREILHKPGKLTDAEMEEVRKHPLNAVEMLDGQDMEVTEIVKHHHERVDGTGYPSKLKDEEISEMAKVLKICDMYSAITSPRPYRPIFSKNDAIKELVQASGKEIDLVLFKKFLKIMSMFPVGSKVKLNNGKIASVAKITQNIFRPVIDIEENGKIQRIDLSNDENFLIHIMGLA